MRHLDASLGDFLFLPDEAHCTSAEDRAAIMPTSLLYPLFTEARALQERNENTHPRYLEILNILNNQKRLKRQADLQSKEQPQDARPVSLEAAGSHQFEKSAPPQSLQPAGSIVRQASSSDSTGPKVKKRRFRWEPDLERRFIAAVFDTGLQGACVLVNYAPAVEIKCFLWQAYRLAPCSLL